MKAVRGGSLFLSFVSLIVLFMYGMAPPGQYELLILSAGCGLIVGFAAFFSTFVFGPLAYPRATLEGLLARFVFAFLAIGLAVVGGSAVRSFWLGAAGAA